MDAWAERLFGRVRELESVVVQQRQLIAEQANWIVELQHRLGIDDLEVVRHGGMPTLFGGTYAPSTLGSFLREFTFGHVRQLDAAAPRFLINVVRVTPLLAGTEAVTYVDVDSLLRRVYGKVKQGVG